MSQLCRILYHKEMRCRDLCAFCTIMPQAPTIDNDVSAAINTILCHLTEKFQGLWWTADEYRDILRSFQFIVQCCLRKHTSSGQCAKQSQTSWPSQGIWLTHEPVCFFLSFPWPRVSTCHDRILGMMSYCDITFGLTRLTSLLTSSLILKLPVTWCK
jgi:hypothetical protein